MPYLLKRNAVYYLRVKIPADLMKWFPAKSKELRKSLRTKERKCAKMALAKHLERTERTFALMRSNLLNETQIKTLVADYLRDTLASNDRVHQGLSTMSPQGLSVALRYHIQSGPKNPSKS